MKKVLSILLVACLLLAAVACDRSLHVPQNSGQTDNTDNTDNTEDGQDTEIPPFDGASLELSAQMFDGARVDLSDTESIGLIAEEEEDPVFEGSTIDRTYIVRFREDGTFEKITFVFTKTDEYSDGSYEVTQEQIEPYPVNLCTTDSFIFVAYSDFEADIDSLKDPEYNKHFMRSDENFAIDRNTGKLYSLSELETFSVCSDRIVLTDGVGLGSDNYYYLSVENGTLTVTDLMPNKNIYVYGASIDAFGNIFVYNESIARREGNIVYVTERVSIGDDGYAYVFRNSLYADFDEPYTIKRYGADGVLQENWSFTDTIIRFENEYGFDKDGYVVLLRNEMYVFHADNSSSWYATWAGGDTRSYNTEAEIFMESEIPVSTNVFVSNVVGEIWYYDLASEKRIDGYDPYVESFGNQGLVMQGDSLYSENGYVFVRVEDTRGTLVYKLEQTTDENGFPSVVAVLQQEIAYETTVIVIQPLN